MIEQTMRQSGYPPNLVRLGKWDIRTQDSTATPDFSPIFQEICQ